MAKSNVTGIDSLVKKLQAISDKAAEKALTRGIRKATARVQASAKKLAPVDTGRLRGSITSRIEKNGNSISGAVGTVVEYASYVEFGTGQRGDQEVEHREDWEGMPPQPFLYPALELNREKIKEDIANELHKELLKYEKR